MQADRSLRSVFVGNIPYDATEEKLRDIFSAVGPVLSFRIVFDRETGKPKGYGFCEYKDQETATSAIRNLNGHDLGGRQLRVDSASNERSRDEPEQGQQPQQDPNMPPNGDPSIQAQLQTQAPQVSEPLVDAQTVINNLLCSLPPEQLFDVCKQLKSSLQINPHETRQLLNQNPQLSFAVLQTLVMIKAIDAQTAMNTIHKPLIQPAPLQLQPMPMMAPMIQPQVMQPFPFVTGPPQPQAAGPMRVPAPSGPQGPMIVPNQSQQGPHQGPAQTTPQPAQMPPMSGPDMTSSGPVAPNDPRLMRQQQQTWPFPAM